MVRVGIVGAGRNTQRRHIPYLRAIEGVEVVSVCNRSVESASAVAQTFGIPRVHASWEELVTSPDCDAVVIGTWPDLHATVSIAALEAGKHVLVEARMARDASEARRMLGTALRHPGLVAQVVPSPLTLGVDAFVQQMISDGALGAVLVVNADWHDDGFMDVEAPLHWRMDRRRSGNNILSLGIVYESLMRWAGFASEVTAVGSVFVAERVDEEKGTPVRVEIPDHLDVVAALEGGAQSHYQFSSVTGLAPEPSLAVHGAAGTLVYRPRSGLLLYGDRDNRRLESMEIPAHLKGTWRVEAEWIAAIRQQGEVMRTTFEDGVRYMEFVDAVNRSLREGRTVPVSGL